MGLFSRSFKKEAIRSIFIVAIGMVAIWIALFVGFGTMNPFYVVASESMVPALEVYDVLVVQGNIPFEDIRLGDVIVFNRPSDHDRVIVHRVISVTDDDPKTIMTKGDANRSSIPGTDYPITEEEYIGKVIHTIPDAGYVTQALKPPVNYIIIAIIIGVIIIKQFKKDDRQQRPSFRESHPHYNTDVFTDEKKDSAYTDNTMHKDKPNYYDNDTDTNDTNDTKKDYDETHRDCLNDRRSDLDDNNNREDYDEKR